MAIVIPSRAQTAGIPAQWDDTISAVDVALITGSEPAVMNEDVVVAYNQNIPALSPVGLDANGELALVTAQIKPIGIAVVAVVTGATGAKKGLPIYRAGCFNPLALVWPAGLYTTEAEKLAAFRDAPTPTNIILRRPKTHQV
jgi:hypothetical protein